MTELNLERMNAFAASSPIASWLGLSIEQDGDETRFHLAFNDTHIGNPAIRAIHGGVIAAFLEFAGQCALFGAIDAGDVETINVDVDYLASSRAQDMTAAVNIAKTGRRIAFLEATAWQDDAARPVATARIRLRLLRE